MPGLTKFIHVGLLYLTCAFSATHVLILGFVFNHFCLLQENLT